MRLKGFIGPSYEQFSKNVDAQKSVNLYAELDEAGTGKDREVAALIRTPGLRLLTTAGTGPGRGLHFASNGRLFAVSGNKLYEYTTTVIERGTLETSHGKACMADNGIQLLIVDGSLTGYIFDFATDTLSAIEDEDFPQASVCAYQDGYFFVNQVGTRNFWFSDLYDGTSWDGLDFAGKEGQPDVLVALISDHRELILLGLWTMEVWYNSGDGDAPFARRPDAFIEHGCAAPHSVQKLDNSVFWLGQDRDGFAMVWKLNGYTPQRVSTHSVELAIQGYSDIAEARSWTYQERGHSFYVLTFGSATWVFDASTGLWHERMYTSADGISGRIRPNDHIFAGVHIVNDYENGNIYALDSETHTDNGAPIIWLRRSPHMSKNQQNQIVASFQLDMETGVGLSSGTDPQCFLRWSDDGGHQWSNFHPASMGKVGEYIRRVIWRRLGLTRDRLWEVSGSAPVKTVLLGADVR